MTTKAQKIKCGFCDKVLEPKELEYTNRKSKIIMSCPNCNAILGFYG